MVVLDRQFCARAVDRVWSSVSLCVLTLETVTGGCREKQERQADRQTDEQSAIETVTDSQWTLKKKQERTERQTERQLVVETMTDS